MSAADVRALLPRTWTAFLGGFDALREVQERAIPAVLAGRDVLVASATASGKTEAYAAPAAEIALEAGCAPATVLVLSPTRALANDLKRRLEGPMERVGVSFGRYTGEHKERVDGRLPAIVVATPEALDSLLARGPRALAGVRLVVIDEVHVLDGTPRGDQLRVLLHRLGRVAHLAPSRVAVSATMDDPRAFAKRYLCDAELVVVSGRRRIRAKAFVGKGLPDVARHVDTLLDAGARKVLAFCRSRNDVEHFAAKLRGRTRFGDSVFAHHGSLAKGKRERTERLFLGAPVGICFATLTLEMGIDIGTVDYVLVVGAPSDVSSLLQRIGRGGRRGDETRFGYVVESNAEAHIVRTMTRLGAEGRLCDRPYAFRPSVLAQQALVLTGKTHLEPAELLAAVPRALWPEVEPTWARELLDELVSRGHLERTGGERYVLTEASEERFARGTLHSNIQDDGGTEVVDRMTGDTVGAVDSPNTRRMNLGGAARHIEGLVAGRILTDSARSADAAYFRPSMGPTVSFELAREVVEPLGVPRGAIGVVSTPGHTLLVHGLGTVGVRALGALLDGGGIASDRASATPYTLGVACVPEEAPAVPPDFVDSLLGRDTRWLERRIAPGPWASTTPARWRAQATREGLALDALAEFLAETRFVELDPDPAALAILAEL